MSEVSDEMLMAFVDGELDETSAAAVQRAIDTDPLVALRADAFAASRQAVLSAFSGILAERPPQRLIDAAQARGAIEAAGDIGAAAEDSAAAREGGVPTSAVILPLRAKPADRRPASMPRYALPLAASLALAIGLGSGLWIGQGSAPPGGSLFPAGGEFSLALGSQPSGPETSIRVDGLATRLAVLGSYAVEGGLCRSFRLENAVEAVRGLACDRGEGFAVAVAIADQSASGSGFAPASDGAAESLDVYLDSLEAQGPLSEEEEALRLRR